MDEVWIHQADRTRIHPLLDETMDSDSQKVADAVWRFLKSPASIRTPGTKHALAPNQEKNKSTEHGK